MYVFLRAFICPKNNNRNSESLGSLGCLSEISFVRVLCMQQTKLAKRHPGYYQVAYIEVTLASYVIYRKIRP